MLSNSYSHKYINLHKNIWTQMLVSVIIPTYNRRDLLKNAISSVIQQSYDEIEIVVVDDGSEEDIEHIVRQFEQGNITYLRHKTNRGATAARNTGISEASGDCIAFLDSDDEWCTEKIERQVEEFRRSPEDVGVVYCDYYNSIADSEYLLIQPHDLRDGNIHPDLLSGWMNIMTSQVLIRRDVFDQIGTFDEELPSFQEYDLLTRIAREYDVVYINERLVIKKTGDFEQIGDDREGRLRGLSKYVQHHESDMRDIFGEGHIQKFAGRRLARTYRSMLCDNIIDRDFEGIRRTILDWMEANTNVEVEDIALILVAVVAGGWGRSYIKRLYFYYKCHKYGFVNKSEIKTV